MHQLFLREMVHAHLGAEWLIDGLIGLIALISQSNDCTGLKGCKHHLFLEQMVHADLGAEWLIDGLFGLIDLTLQDNHCTGP